MSSGNLGSIEPKSDLSLKIEAWDSRWKRSISQRLRVQMSDADPAHGLEHVQRVVTNACLIAKKLVNRQGELGSREVDFEVLLPAAWFHDCVYVPKNSAQRSEASRLAAERAVELLAELDYPALKFPAISHAIESHSFSAQIPCQSLEAQVLQDADRLEALGAIGLARCLMTGGSMGQRLYHPEDPFPTARELRDDQQSVDHFFSKLLKLPSTMQTESGREIASQRAGYLVAFLVQLSEEIGVPIQISKEFLGLQNPPFG